MEQLWVADSYYDTGHALYRPASPAEVLAAAATLDGAKFMVDITDDLGDWHPGRFLVIPLPDKETTDE